MLRRFLAALGLVLAFVAAQASAQSLTTYTFSTLPGSPTAGQLAWITDNSGTPTIGSPAAGGAGAGNRDLVSWDATQTRWEFVARQPTAGPAVPVSTLFDSVRIAYANGTSGASASDVQGALDELFGLRTATQPTPTVTGSRHGTFGAFSNPATTNGGFGFTWDNPSTFTAKTYPGGPTTGNEPDNQLGSFYNMTGVNGSVISQYEHALNDSWELSYRDTVGTGDKTWLERNWDFFPPTNSSVLSSSTGSFVAGDTITFSGGGTGQIVSASGSNPTVTIIWNQNFGTTAAGQTVTNISRAGGGTLAAPTYLGQSPSYSLRGLQLVWETVPNTIAWNFETLPNAAVSTLRMQNGNVTINSAQVPNGFLHVQTKTAAKAAIRSEYAYDESQTGSVAYGIVHRPDYSATNSTNDLLDYRGLLFESPVSPSVAAYVNRTAAIEFLDQRGVGGTDGATIRFKSQTCAGIACTGPNWGNVEHQGGDWNTGHLTFGGSSPYDADHLWRDQTNDRFRIKTGSGPSTQTDGRLLGEVVASGTRAMATSAIAAGACNTADSSITATGAVSTDRVQFSPNADPGLNAGLLIYSAWAGSGVISFRVCNPSAGSLTPAAVSMNWAVVR